MTIFRARNKMSPSQVSATEWLNCDGHLSYKCVIKEPYTSARVKTMWVYDCWNKRSYRRFTGIATSFKILYGLLSQDYFHPITDWQCSHVNTIHISPTIGWDAWTFGFRFKLRRLTNRFWYKLTQCSLIPYIGRYTSRLLSWKSR